MSRSDFCIWFVSDRIERHGASGKRRTCQGCRPCVVEDGVLDVLWRNGKFPCTLVDRTRHCRGADSRARRRTYSPYKPPSKWQTLPICHCEEANGRRGALSAKREEVPLGCNLGKAVPFSPLVPLLSDRILRDSHVASLLGMTNLRASRHRMRIADIASLHGGHGPPCRLTFGLCHYGIGSSAPGAACRSPAMRHRQSADQDTVAGSYSDAERLSDSSTRAWR